MSERIKRKKGCRRTRLSRYRYRYQIARFERSFEFLSFPVLRVSSFASRVFQSSRVFPVFQFSNFEFSNLVSFSRVSSFQVFREFSSFESFKFRDFNISLAQISEILIQARLTCRSPMRIRLGSLCCCCSSCRDRCCSCQYCRYSGRSCRSGCGCSCS